MTVPGPMAAPPGRSGRAKPLPVTVRGAPPVRAGLLPAGADGPADLPGLLVQAPGPGPAAGR